MRARYFPSARLGQPCKLCAELVLMEHEDRLLVEQHIESCGTTERVMRMERFLRTMYPDSVVTVEMYID